MERSGPRRQLTDEEIQEIIFLPDGYISDVDIDSDPDDPEYDPRQDRRFVETCPLEIVTKLRDFEVPQVESNDVLSGSSEMLARTSPATSGKKNTTREASICDHKAPDDKNNDTSSGLSGQLPHTPSANQSNEMKTKQRKALRIWKKDLPIEDSSWKGKLLEPLDDVLCSFEYFSTFFDNEIKQICIRHRKMASASV
ncbi:unnamed protein product [Ixodes hexagonus]